MFRYPKYWNVHAVFCLKYLFKVNAVNTRCRFKADENRCCARRETFTRIAFFFKSCNVNKAIMVVFSVAGFAPARHICSKDNKSVLTNADVFFSNVHFLL